MRKQRDFAAEYARRLARAFENGLSRSAARGHARAGEPGVRGPPRAIPDVRLQLALKTLRDTGSLTKAAKAARISPERLRHLGSEGTFIQKTGRKWVIGPGVKRSIEIFTNGAKRTVTVASPADASLAGEYRNAVYRFLSRPQDRRVLLPLQGKSVRDINGVEHPLETDPNTLYRLTLSSDHAAEQIYRIHL